MGGGQNKPAWTACPPGVKITRVGGKITRDSLPPGGQAVQGGKINCYSGHSLKATSKFEDLIGCEILEAQRGIKLIQQWTIKNNFLSHNVMFFQCRQLLENTFYCQLHHTTPITQNSFKKNKIFRYPYYLI